MRKLLLWLLGFSAVVTLIILVVVPSPRSLPSSANDDTAGPTEEAIAAAK